MPGRNSLQVVRFGVFVLDLETGELRRNGQKVRLQEQPLQVLATLLEKPGGLVTREELRARLWPADTFVDFEHGINASIKRLREALGESAEAPVFIETLAKRGYRFAGSIHGVPSVGEADLRGTLPVSHSKKLLVVFAGLLLFSTACALFLYLRLRAPQPAPPIRVVPLTSLPGVKMTPSFSASGNQIAFAWNRPGLNGAELYVKLIREGEPRQLTHSGTLNFNPVWSPDDQRIAFVRSSQRHAAIFTISAYGEGERKLLSLNGGEERRISWSPDGKFLAFADNHKNQLSGGSSIFLLSLDTLEKRELTSPPTDSTDEGPAFSPDGRSVAFVRGSMADNASGFDLYLVRTAGGEPQRMTSGAKVFWTGPTWTEDGREIVFSSKRSGTSALWRIPASGGESQPLEFGSDDSIEPYISPRGHRLAYMRFPLDVNIYRAVLPDAKHPENTTAPFLASTRQDADGQVSPNSKRIAFDSDRSGNTREIWVCDLDGANCVQVTSLGTWARIPRWSPDGKQIVFEASSGGKTSIYTVDPESRAVRGVVPNPWEERAPSWSSDGRWIYFASKRSGAWQIWRSPAEGGASLQITKHGGFRPFQSPDSRFVYYETGTEVPGVWRVPSEGGEESSVLGQPNIQMADNWALVDDGIYFIQFDLHGQKPGAILFYDFATKHVRTTVKLGTNHILNEGLTVSPDKRSFFYNVWEHSAGDIMFVENFH